MQFVYIWERLQIYLNLLLSFKSMELRVKYKSFDLGKFEIFFSIS
jgi:hypothetical protein